MATALVQQTILPGLEWLQGNPHPMFNFVLLQILRLFGLLDPFF